MSERARGHLLVVDDNEVWLNTLSRIVTGAGFTGDCTSSVGSALERLRATHYDAAIVDIFLQDGTGLEVLREAQKVPDPPSVILVSGKASVPLAIEAMKSGAVDVLEKPLGGSELIYKLERALEARLLRQRLRALDTRGARARQALTGYESPAMKAALSLADRVAATPSSSALIVGESGVGKEVIASRIHETSDRCNRPFVRVNMAAIPETMLEAELFGSVRGAFTDAKRHRAGHIASADGGTLLLDEIGEFRVEHQPKLLRCLEERRFFPVGSDRERDVDVRVLAATNREPHELVQSGLLRADLFYRLGIVIRIPPLRERTDEIIPLISYYTKVFSTEFARPAPRLTDEAAAMLRSYRWPGNVRELRNAVERALMLCDRDTLQTTDFDFIPVPKSMPVIENVESANESVASPLLEDAKRDAVGNVERQRIAHALDLARGSRAQAARMLGISRSTLYEKMKRYSLE